MKKLIIASACLMFLSGCATVAGKTTGFLYSSAMHPEAATSNEAGRKMGKACQKSYLGWVATGDASIQAARRAGGISQITSVDAETNAILGLYAKYCTVVRGN